MDFRRKEALEYASIEFLTTPIETDMPHRCTSDKAGGLLRDFLIFLKMERNGAKLRKDTEMQEYLTSTIDGLEGFLQAAQKARAKDFGGAADEIRIERQLTQGGIQLQKSAALLDICKNTMIKLVEECRAKAPDADTAYFDDAIANYPKMIDAAGKIRAAYEATIAEAIRKTGPAR